MVSCSRVEHSVDFTTAVKKVLTLHFPVVIACWLHVRRVYNFVAPPIVSVIATFWSWKCKFSPSAVSGFSISLLHPHFTAYFQSGEHKPCRHVYRNGRKKVGLSASKVQGRI